MVTKLFVKGAYLWTPITMDRELSEQEFIDRVGITEVLKFRQYPFVSLVFDRPSEQFLVGHIGPRTIALAMSRHNRFQTMEWRNAEYNWKCVSCGTERPSIGPKPEECEVCGNRKFSQVHARKKEFYN